MAGASALTVENAYLARHLVRRALSRNNIHINGHLKQQTITSAQLRAIVEDQDFQKAVAALEKANDVFMDKHKNGVMSLVQTVDITDGQLHSEFVKAAGQVVDEIRWGRIASLFFLTSLLAERLINEGQGSKVEGLVIWLAQFLDSHVSSWIEQRGGWAAISDALTPEPRVPPVQQPTAPEVKGSWFTVAALGVGFGALLVGSLAMK